MNLTLKGFLFKEITQTIRDVRMRAILFVAPILQLILFGYALSNDVRNIRLAAIYLPGDVMAQRIIERCFASGWFIPAQPSSADPFQMIQSGQAHAVLVAPPGGLTKSLRQGQGTVQVLIDSTNVVRARGIELYLQAILRQVAGDAFPGQTGPPNLELSVRVLYNPTLQTMIFMVPAIMCVLLCLMTIILTNMSLAREKEMGTFETLVAAPVKIWEILLGKTLPFILLAMLDVPLILGAAVIFFGIPMRGQLWELVLAAFIFICTTVSIGTLISTFARNQQQAMLGGFMFLLPAILLSGIMFPIENMPPALIGVAYLNPLKYFITLLRNIILKGGDPGVVWPNLGILVGMAVVSIWVAAKRFHQTLN